LMKSKGPASTGEWVILTLSILTIVTLPLILGSLIVAQLRDDECPDPIRRRDTISSDAPVLFFGYRYSDDTYRNISFDLLGPYIQDPPTQLLVFDFGDGSRRILISSVNFSHVYPRNINYTARLFRVDGRNDHEELWSMTIIAFEHENLPPRAIARYNKITVVLHDQPVLLSAEGSYDPDGTIIGYFWDFGDGTWSDKTQGIDGFVPGMVICHSYEKTGSYSAKLFVMDNEHTISPEPDSINVVILSSCFR